MSDNKNPVMGVITFSPGSGSAETVTDPKGMQPIDVPSLMRAAGFDDGLEAAVREIELCLEGHEHASSNCSDFGCGDLKMLIKAIRARKNSP